MGRQGHWKGSPTLVDDYLNTVIAAQGLDVKLEAKSQARLIAYPSRQSPPCHFQCGSV